MQILQNIEVPTGNILIVQGEHGKLECLSLGDYGKDVNLNQHKKVTHTDLLPLTEKWVITISTQYGCSMGCKFCDVPKVGRGLNATADDLINQVCSAMSIHPETQNSKRLNIHYARMGEPTWNHNVITATRYLINAFGDRYMIHPVVSTMMPKSNFSLPRFLSDWVMLKNFILDGNAGLQLSVNSTNEKERQDMFNNNAMTLQQIADVMQYIAMPKGRKYTLNFAVADYEIDPNVLLKYFSPDKYIVKLTPMHKTCAAIANNIETEGDYTEPYAYLHHEEALQNAGYETLTFIASEEEDASRITCGNAILALKGENNYAN